MAPGKIPLKALPAATFSKNYLGKYSFKLFGNVTKRTIFVSIQKLFLILKFKKL